MIFSASYGSWNPMMENDSRLTQCINQLSSRYQIPIPAGLNTLPIHREPVEKFLRFAIDSLELTVGEREDVELLLKKVNGNKKLFSRDSDQARVTANLDISGKVDIRQKDSLSYGLKGIINPSISGFLGGLSFSAEFDMLTEIQSDSVWYVSSYEPIDGNPYNLNLAGRSDSGNVRTSDIFRGGASWNLGLSSWDFGVDNLKLGPTIHNPLFMNFDKSPVTFVRVNLNFPWFDYTHGVIKPQSLRDYKRFMMYHRYEIPFFKEKLTVGLNETVIYGSSPDSTTERKYGSDPVYRSYNDQERTFEPVYVIPFLPFAFMEHFSGDRENKQLSLDASLAFPKNFRWNLEFMLDDMSAPHTLFSDDWGNKWAFALGGQWFTTVGQKNLTISSEYSRIEPWVYTHFRGTSHRYEHFGSPIGSDLGPNSDDFWAESELQLNQKNRIAMSFENKRWNHDQRGGSISDIYVDDHTVFESNDSVGNPTLERDSETKKFLDGNVQSEQIVTAKWLFLPYHLYEMDTRLNWSSKSGFSIGLFGGFRF